MSSHDLHSQYYSLIKDVFNKSDMNTVSVADVRNQLTEKTNEPFRQNRREINALIKKVYLEYQQKESLVVNTTASKVVTDKKSKVDQKKVMKATKKVTTEDKPKKTRVWPLVRLSPPLSDIVGTTSCARPHIVKKLWEYVREHNLQLPEHKATLKCDEKLKELCGGLETVSSFGINKHIQQFIHKIPEEELAKLQPMEE
ncbi:SWIB/MDM2 domain-containing protein [Pilobolus umbonatus]|nr:SWIB/MDM2 domain-containing protein [Pilobolus umbonatus]